MMRSAAAYDVKKSEYYKDDYDTYFISFYIPKGQILAAGIGRGKAGHLIERKIPGLHTEQYADGTIADKCFPVLGIQRSPLTK